MSRRDLESPPWFTIVSQQTFEIPGRARMLPITGRHRRTLMAMGKKPPNTVMKP